MMLTIITPHDKHLYEITWVEFNTPAGNVVVQQGHAPTILTLAPKQKITFGLSNGKRESLIAAQGIVHITRTTTTVILNDEK